MSPAAPDDPTITAAGPIGAPAIVFLHGTRLTRSAWAGQLDALGDEFRTIAIDLPAHGSRAGEPFALERRGRSRCRHDPGPGGRRIGRRRWAVAWWLRGDGPRRASTRIASAAWSWLARPPNRSGIRSIPYRGLGRGPGSLRRTGIEPPQRLVLPSAGTRPRSPSRSWPAGSGRGAARARCAPCSASGSRRAWPPTRARP